MHRPIGNAGGRLLAVLGPTNTGKTHYAVERMLGHSSGVIGFPLRLLAREIFDRVVAIKGPAKVALLTGEEKIVPDNPAYWVCTVESMPVAADVAFVGVDEIQLAADWQRGHIFTDRLLRARGREETVFMGAETVRPLIRRLLPDAEILTRTRFSQLKYVKPAKLNRLPRRSAIVGFSAESVYGLAELVRRNRGGTAVVMGALSPRTRNAQVELYQSGDVDYLVATDAIGMGLNMDIDHVAFAASHKFDGRTVRALTAAEVGQIAGRAGRHMNDGTFSTIAGGEADLDPLTVAQVEEHSFKSLKQLQWRNAKLDFKSPRRLIASLEQKPAREELVRTSEALDLAALKALAADPAVVDIVTTPAAARRLWEICQIPDFRKLSNADHLNLLRRIYKDLAGPKGVIAHDWIASQVSRLDNVQGDIDTLAARIAGIRTWTYVANRRDWLADAAHWAYVTRSIEDKLSDALHERLTQRFVDRRTSVLMRELRQRGELSVTIEETNEIVVEGHAIGRLDGFSFRADPSAAGDEHKMLESAADRTLKAEIARRAKIFTNIGWKTLKLDFSHGLHNPRLLWQDAPVAVIVKGGSAYEPQARLIADTMLAGPPAEQVRDKCQAWLDERLAAKLEPLIKLKAELDAPGDGDGEAPLSGLARGIAFQLLERYGVLPRGQVAEELRQVDQDARKGLRRFHIRIGAIALYMPPVLKPHAVELRLMLWAVWNDIRALPPQPTPGLVWIQTAPSAPREFYEIAGFRLIGENEAVRLDMLERLADAVRPLGKGGEKFTVSPEIMGLVGCSGDSFVRVMRTLGYGHETELVDKPPEALPAPASGAEEQTGVQDPTIARAAADAEPSAQAAAPEAVPSAEAAAAAAHAAPESFDVQISPEAAQEPAAEPAPKDLVGSKPQPEPETAVPDDATAPEDAPEDAGETTEPQSVDAALDAMAEPRQMEVTRFFWAPQRARKGQAGGDGGAEAGKGAPRRGKGRPGRVQDRPPGHRPADRKGGTKPASAKGPGKRSDTGRSKKPAAPPRDRPANEDSPFAALKGLKDALEKRGK